MYTEFFGFSDKPFRLTPDAKMFYPSDQHRRGLAFLEYGLHEGEGFVVVTGEPGTGKTTLVTKLVDDYSNEPIRVVTIETSNLSGHELISTIIDRFGYRRPSPPKSKAEELMNLRNILRHVEDAGHRSLLIVDEAQNLSIDSIEELRMLSNLTGRRGPLLQTLLTGQTSLARMLATPQMEQFRQRITASFHLTDFDATDTTNYIRFRLGRVGWADDPAFEPEACERIHEITGGKPRLINLLCDRILLYCFLEQQHGVTTEIADAVAAETGVALHNWSEDIIEGGPAAEAAPCQDESGAADPVGAREQNVPEHPAAHASDADPFGLVTEIINRLTRLDNTVQRMDLRLRAQLARIGNADGSEIEAPTNEPRHLDNGTDG